MRGLGERERFLLEESTFTGDPTDDCPDMSDADAALMANLLTAGRVSHREVLLEDSGDICDTWDATELGRLALRVCPVVET